MNAIRKIKATLFALLFVCCVGLGLQPAKADVFKVRHPGYNHSQPVDVVEGTGFYDYSHLWTPYVGTGNPTNSLRSNH